MRDLLREGVGDTQIDTDSARIRVDGKSNIILTGGVHIHLHLAFGGGDQEATEDALLGLTEAVLDLGGWLGELLREMRGEYEVEPESPPTAAGPGVVEPAEPNAGPEPAAEPPAQPVTEPAAEALPGDEGAGGDAEALPPGGPGVVEATEPQPTAEPPGGGDAQQ